MIFEILIFIYILLYQHFICKLRIQDDDLNQVILSKNSLGDDQYNFNTSFVYFDLIDEYNFDRGWANKFQVKEGLNKNTKKCPKCNFQPTLKQPFLNFKKRKKADLVMTIYTKSLYGMIVLARSLRTTGSQASIVYFVDSAIYDKIANKSKTLKLYQICGITLINYGESPQPYNCIVNYRFIFFCEFMKRHYLGYNKVIITDGYDTVFQSDPFLNDWNPEVIYLTIENNRNSVTRGWYDRLFPNEYLGDVLISPIINNGVIAGYSANLYRYLDFYTRSYQWKKWRDTLDQALVNFLFYKGMFKEAGIKVQGIRAGEGFLASIYNCYGTGGNQKLGIFDPKSKKIFPSLIHKFSEPRLFAKNVYAQCPRLKWQRDETEYIRGVSYQDMAIIDKYL